MLAKTQSFDPFSLLRTEMDRLLDEHLGSSWINRSSGLPNRRAAFPALNIWENGEAYFAEAECPGLNIQDFDLSIAGRQVSLSGERREEYPENTSFHRRERGTSKFSRTLTLPGDIDPAKVEASLANGVLTIRLPKTESAKPRKVEVKS